MVLRGQLRGRVGRCRVFMVRPSVNNSRSAFFYRSYNAQNRENVTLVFNDPLLPSGVLTHQGREFNIQLLIYLAPVQVVIWLL